MNNVYPQSRVHFNADATSSLQCCNCDDGRKSEAEETGHTVGRCNPKRYTSTKTMELRLKFGTGHRFK